MEVKKVKKALLGAAFGLLSTQAVADKWVALTFEDNFIVSLNASSLYLDGKKATAWIMHSPVSEPFFHLAEYEFDCVKSEIRRGDSVILSNQEGISFMTSPAKMWRSPKAGTAKHHALKLACSPFALIEKPYLISRTPTEYNRAITEVYKNAQGVGLK